MMSGKLLVANRGEIATRICRAAEELGIATVAVHPLDDAASGHTRKASQTVVLPGRGVAAYLDVEAVIGAARETGADAIHPGYGFLAENTGFAQRCAEEGITFVGPSPQTLALFGDKHAARRLATAQGIPTLAGTDAPTTLLQARAFLSGLGADGAVMVKAVAGGGGRGMRPVLEQEYLQEAFERCQSEAMSGFGNGDLYVEQLLRNARHIEVQILGDGEAVSHLWERDCSLQRRRQKIVEIAPAPRLEPDLRDRLIEAALQLAKAAKYRNLGTIEFLVDTRREEFFFIEANPRLQVEHTVTEAVTGLDLVQLQLQLGRGRTLAELGLSREQIVPSRGMAMQLRINTETIGSDGSVTPGGGTLTAFEPPSGHGLRVDTHGYVGYPTSSSYDSLLAKLVVHTGSTRLGDLITKAYRALCEFNIAGSPTTIGFLQALLCHEAVRSGAIDTDFVTAHSSDLAVPREEIHPRLYMEPGIEAERSGVDGPANVDRSDPLAVLAWGQPGQSSTAHSSRRGIADDVEIADGLLAIRAPLQGTVVSVAVTPGTVVAPKAQLAVIEAMKMEHVIDAQSAGTIISVHVQSEDTLAEGQLLAVLQPGDVTQDLDADVQQQDPNEIRADLAEVLERRALTRDDQRPNAVARRRKTNHRTVRENVEDLLEPGSFVEYGPLVVAAQRQRRDIDDLLTRSPADGLVTGVGRVNGELFGDPASRVAVMAYDYTVFAGTQGVHNHWKTDRLIGLAEQGRMPLVLFAEGGGGRPGDSDYGGFVGQNTFYHFGRLSGLVPMVGIVAGRCFAGNASLLGCCDVIIATADANIGMGGPAMIEGGGLGIFAPEDVGPMADQVPNGVVDIAVGDEAEAVDVAKRYLAYFQGRMPNWSEPEQLKMRTLVPENRLRVYAVRDVLETLADEGSVLELRGGFGRTMITAFVRIEGRAVGVVANDPAHLGGAIDSDGADKAARFMQLCDAFDIPLLYLCDTPGIMVGPEVEKTALVRHAARLFLVGCNLSVPYFTVVLRKAYGLGAIGMAGGNYRAPSFTVAWPSGEFGSMGLEGQVKLGYRAELEAIEDPQERLRYFEEMVAQAYEDGKAVHKATSFAIDDTIDPAETRFWLANMLASIRPPLAREGKKRPMIDAW